MPVGGLCCWATESMRTPSLLMSIPAATQHPRMPVRVIEQQRAAILRRGLNRLPLRGASVPSVGSLFMT